MDKCRLGCLRCYRTVSRWILVDSLSWRYIFFLNVPFGIIACLMIAIYYKESIKPAKHHIDYLGATVFSLSTIALLYALLTGSSKQNWGDITIIYLLIFAVVSFIIFLFIEKNLGTINSASTFL